MEEFASIPAAIDHAADILPATGALPASGVLPVADPVPAPLSRQTTRERNRVLAAALVVTGLASLDGNIVGPALPRIVSDLGGLAHLSWVVTGFSVASTAATPIYGWLSDTLGRKLAFTVSIGIFLAGSVFCGAAHSMTWLIAARAAQGIGAGGLLTLAQTTIGDVLAPWERARFQGLIASVFAVCSVAGPLLGGAVTDYLSWPWIFYFNLPLGLVALGMILGGPVTQRHTGRRHFDGLGFALVIFATCAFMLALSWGGTTYPWASPQIGVLLGSAALATIALVIVEHRVPEPALPPSLFANKVIGRNILAISLAVTGMFGSLVFVPLYFQLVDGASATEAGLRTAPLMAGMIVSSFLGGRAVAWTGRIKPFPVAGTIVAGCAMAALGWSVRAGVGANGFDLLLVVLGAGMGLVMPNTTTAIQNAARPGELGVAMATSAFFRALGGAFGVSMAGTVLSATLQAHHLGGSAGGLANAGVDGIRTLPEAQRAAVILGYADAVSWIFAICACALVLALIAGLSAPEAPLRKR